MKDNRLTIAVAIGFFAVLCLWLWLLADRKEPEAPKPTCDKTHVSIWINCQKAEVHYDNSSTNTFNNGVYIDGLTNSRVEMEVDTIDMSQKPPAPTNDPILEATAGLRSNAMMYGFLMGWRAAWERAEVTSPQSITVKQSLALRDADMERFGANMPVLTNTTGLHAR